MTFVACVRGVPGSGAIAPRSGAAASRSYKCHAVESFIAAEGSRYGDTATRRMSFARYNTKDGVDTLAESMVKAREFFA